MDLIDKKILCELDEDCRQSYSRIGKKLRVGRNRIEYRIERLEKNGIITNYISTLNLGLIGFHTYKIFLKISKSKDTKDLISFLLNDKSILSIVEMEGYFDLSFSIAVESIEQLDSFLTLLRTNFKDLIKRHYVSVILYTKIFKLRKLLLEDKKQIQKPLKLYNFKETLTLDNKDKKILEIISQRANLGLLDISKETNLSLEIVKYRLKKLKDKLIYSNRAIFDLSKLGYYHYNFLLKINNPTRLNEEKINSWCLSKENIIYYGKRIGEFDFEINVAISNIEEFNSFINNLKETIGEIVESYEIIINKNILKLNYFPCKDI
jgi:Lrp/AsnC family leucine-responsive transcriptional regulator